MAGSRAASRFGRRPLNAVAGCQTDFEFDDLVPDGVGALVIRNGKKFAQAATRVRKLWFVAQGLGKRRLVGCGLDGRLFDGVFFVHWHIIARIMHSVPV